MRDGEGVSTSPRDVQVNSTEVLILPTSKGNKVLRQIYQDTLLNALIQFIFLGSLFVNEETFYKNFSSQRYLFLSTGKYHPSIAVICR